MNSYKNLGELYNDEFFHLEEALEPHEISLMENVLDKNQFYRFNPLKFNIYYCMLIVSGFLVTMSLATHYVFTINQLRDLIDAKGTTTQTSLPDINMGNIDTETADVKLNKIKSSVDKNNNKALNRVPKSNINSGSTINIIKENLIENNINEPSIIDNKNIELKENEIVNLPKQDNILNNTIAKPRAKRIVYVTQQDTLYQRDTLKAIPRKGKK